jgi:protein EFR3
MTCHYNFRRSFILSYYCSMISQVVYAVLENYESPYANVDNDDAVEDIRIQWVDEVLKAEGHEPPAVTILTRVPSWKVIRAVHGELSLTM